MYIEGVGKLKPTNYTCVCVHSYITYELNMRALVYYIKMKIIKSLTRTGVCVCMYLWKNIS